MISMVYTWSNSEFTHMNPRRPNKASIQECPITAKSTLVMLAVELHLKLSQVLHLKVTHLEEPEYGSSVLGFSSFCLLGFLRRAVFEAVAIVAGFNDVAVMSQPVE